MKDQNTIPGPELIVSRPISARKKKNKNRNEQLTVDFDGWHAHVIDENDGFLAGLRAKSAVTTLEKTRHDERLRLLCRRLCRETLRDKTRPDTQQSDRAGAATCKPPEND